MSGLKFFFYKTRDQMIELKTRRKGDQDVTEASFVLKKNWHISLLANPKDRSKKQ